MAILELFDTRYRDFTAKHFSEKLVSDHGISRSYNWVRLTLQAHGRKYACRTKCSVCSEPSEVASATGIHALPPLTVMATSLSPSIPP